MKRIYALAVVVTIAQPGDDFTATFADPGTFTYFCSIDPSMTATIVVEG
jgi:plastocyanin